MIQPAANLVPIFIPDEQDRAICPTCGMKVRIVRRPGGFADHYEALLGGEQVDKSLPPQDPETAAALRELRKGKKTVALVGMASTSCSLAPFNEPGVEIWGLNEAHAFGWMKGATRWFQIHATESWKRYIAKRDVRGHFDWLKEKHYSNYQYPSRKATLWDMIWRLLHRSEAEHLTRQAQEGLMPIYMQYWHPLVPGSVGYPLHEVVDKLFYNFRRGDAKVKYFTSTFAYMMGIALLEDFERIEVYGFEMADDIEYVKQKACAEFWIGLAMGRGIEVYTPPNCQILYSALYGGNEQGAGW